MFHAITRLSTLYDQGVQLPLFDSFYMDQGALLKTLLYELKDGVIVCDSGARITLFNQAAEDLFAQNKLLKKGLSLYDFCYQPPVEEALHLLAYQHDLSSQAQTLPYIQFMNKAVGRNQYFRCRVSFSSPSSAGKKSFVLVLEDISAWYTPENPLLLKIEEFRAPMTNIRAAVENLTEYPEMSPVMRSAFENVLVQETHNLTEAFDDLARSCNVLMQTQNHLMQLSTEVLFSYVTHHLGHQGIAVTATPDAAICVKVDIYGLLLMLDFFADKIGQEQAKKGLTCEAHVGEQFIFLDFIWSGKYMATGSVSAMLEEQLEYSLGEMPLGSLLHAMDGDIWSQQHNKKKSMLRLALPIVKRADN